MLKKKKSVQTIKKAKTKKKIAKKVTAKATKKIAPKVNKQLAKKVVSTKKVKKVSTTKKTVASLKGAAQIVVEKKKDGILIKVSNPDVLAELIKAINQKRIGEETIQMMETGKLLDWLDRQSAPNFNSYKVTWNNDLYRVCSKSYRANSISGSLSCGGRLNLGGSQKRKEFSSLKPFGALYFSEELNTAIREYSDSAPLGPNDFKYKVSLKKSFDLWDFDKIVDLLSAYPSLKDTVRSSPMNGKAFTALSALA